MSNNQLWQRHTKTPAIPKSEFYHNSHNIFPLKLKTYGHFNRTIYSTFLYSLRKGGKTNKDKREMAKAFQRVLERTPNLKENENLVALNKIDIPLHQPTKSVKKQLNR